MAQIAAEAGAQRALLHQCCSGRDALVFAVIETRRTALQANVVAAERPSFPPEQRLFRPVRTVLGDYPGADDAHEVRPLLRSCGC
jgi:AcrR family transcriptional regulator